MWGNEMDMAYLERWRDAGVRRVMAVARFQSF